MRKKWNLIILFMLVSFMGINNIILSFGETEAEEYDIRGMDNMAITSSNTAIEPKGVKINWSKKYSNDYGPTSQQIIIDETLIFTVKDRLFKVDINNGQIIHSVKMSGIAKNSQIAPAYGEGKIFVPIGKGRIQAFDANTLNSLWIYEDILEGDVNTPITYSKGHIYTGFWKSESGYTNYVCLSVKDKDVSNKYENKEAVWTKSNKGGYYNAGALIIGDNIVFGSDNGSENRFAKSNIYALSTKNGKVKSQVTIVGDQRSSISFRNNKIYFTTNAGYLYAAHINPSSGKISKIKGVYYDLESECTPAVYKDRIYVGFGTDKNGRIIVADENTMKEIYSVKINGTPNDSLLLSNAYENETEKIYIYATYDNLPGKISVIETKENATKNNNIKSTDLLKLDYNKQGYCKNSVICDNNGNIYYSNNSGYIFSIGKKNKIQVNFNPDNGQKIITKEVYENEALNYVPDKPIQKDHKFIDWFTDVNDEKTKYKYGKTYTESVTYTAKYKKLNNTNQDNTNKDNKENKNEDNKNQVEKSNKEKNDTKASNNKSSNENSNMTNKENIKEDDKKQGKSDLFVLTLLFISSTVGLFAFLYQGK